MHISTDGVKKIMFLHLAYKTELETLCNLSILTSK